MSQPDNLILESIQNDVALIGAHLQIIAQKVIDEQISDFPLFVASQQIVNIGRPVFDRDEVQTNWFFNASILEEFIKNGLISQARLGNFRDTFGDPKERACIFVITGEEGQFIFVPYDIEPGTKAEGES